MVVWRLEVPKFLRCVQIETVYALFVAEAKHGLLRSLMGFSNALRDNQSQST